MGKAANKSNIVQRLSRHVRGEGDSDQDSISGCMYGRRVGCQENLVSKNRQAQKTSEKYGPVGNSGERHRHTWEVAVPPKKSK